MHDGATPVMDALVDFVCDLATPSLPLPVVDAASRSLTDWLGTAIRGAAEPLADALATVIRDAGGNPQATVVGRGLRTSALLAALAERVDRLILRLRSLGDLSDVSELAALATV